MDCFRTKRLGRSNVFITLLEPESSALTELSLTTRRKFGAVNPNRATESPVQLMLVPVPKMLKIDK